MPQYVIDCYSIQQKKYTDVYQLNGGQKKPPSGEWGGGGALWIHLTYAPGGVQCDLGKWVILHLLHTEYTDITRPLTWVGGRLSQKST